MCFILSGNYAPQKDLSLHLGILKLPKRLDTLAHVERDLSIRNFELSKHCLSWIEYIFFCSFLSLTIC